LAIESIAMTSPVFGGDTLYAESVITGLDPGHDPDVGIVSLELRGLNQRGERVCEMACTIEVYRTGRHPDDVGSLPAAAQPRFSLYHGSASGALVEQTGLAFEDMVEGETFEHWPGRTIDLQESRMRAVRSLEINPRWHDDAYIARQGEPALVYEPLVIGTLTALTTRTFGRVAANLGWNGIRMA